MFQVEYGEFAWLVGVAPIPWHDPIAQSRTWLHGQRGPPCRPVIDEKKTSILQIQRRSTMLLCKTGSIWCERCGRSLPSGYTSHHPNTSPVHSLALALILAASGGRAQAVQRKAVGCKAVGCKAMGCKPWGCNTGEVVVVRWCGEVVERWEHVHVHTHTPHTHRRMS